MAKGNMLNGTVKGRIGGAVYYVKQGEQNIVKYNKEIANPRTGRQMYQRARFSNAGRFFTRGRQNYFKFAFEGKKQSQSDFNAFMAYNINRSVLISRSALQLEGYPAIGKFIMSQGSLQPVQCRVVNDYWQAAFGVFMPEGGVSTIGELSRALISTGNYAQGDILTFVFIWTTGSAYIPSAQPMGTASTTWHLKQFILNPSDSTPLSNYEMRAATRAWDNTPLLTLTDLEDSQILATSYSGFCCVHSRNTRSGLKVSTQELALGESMQEAYEYAQTSEYVDSVIADWQSTGNITYSPDAILKGSLSYSASPVTGITLGEVPASQWQLSGNTFYTDEEIYPFNLLTPAAIMGVGVVPGMFQADNISGDAAAYVSFVQAATNQVDVHIDSTTLPAGVYAVRIYMLKGEQRIPICNIVWTSVTGEMEIEPFRLDTENWSINGNTLSLNTPYDSTGERFVIGFDSPDELSAENFSAEKTSGGDGTSMRFSDVSGEIRGAISITSPADGTYSYNVFYTHDGNKQLVAVVNFAVEFSEENPFITTNPRYSNSASWEFQTDEPLPQDTMIVYTTPESSELDVFQRKTNTTYGGFNVPWVSAENRWHVADPEVGECTIEPLGDNRYRMTQNLSSTYAEIVAAVNGSGLGWENRITKLVNNDVTIMTFVTPENIEGMAITAYDASFEGFGSTIPRKKIASMKILHNGGPVTDATFTYEGVSNDRGLELVFNESTNEYDIFVWFNNSNFGTSSVSMNGKLLFTVDIYEE